MEELEIKSKIKYVIIGIAILCFQVVFADKLRIFGIAPNFILSFVMIVSFLGEEKFGFWYAIIFGMLFDALSGHIFGQFTFIFVLSDLLIKYVFYKLFAKNYLFEFFGGVLLNLIFSFFISFVTWLFRGNFVYLFFRIGLFEVIYNSIIFALFVLIEARKYKRPRKVSSAYRV